MRTQVWRIAMIALFIFGLGCVGCAKRPTSSPFIPPPTRFAGESAVYATTTSQMKGVHFAFDKAAVSPAVAQILAASAE